MPRKTKVEKVIADGSYKLPFYLFTRWIEIEAESRAIMKTEEIELNHALIKKEALTKRLENNIAAQRHFWTDVYDEFKIPTNITIFIDNHTGVVSRMVSELPLDGL